MKTVDLSSTIVTDAPVFPGYPKPVILKWTVIEKHGYYSNVLHMVEHTLTHVDSPAHFIKGAPTIDKVTLDHFMGKAIALDLRDEEEGSLITESDIKKYVKAPTDIKIVILYTGWEKKTGSEDYFKGYPGLSKDAAEYLRDLDMKAVGIDGPDIDHHNSEGFPAHHVLLSAGMVIYEGLVNLKEVAGKTFNFIGLPLKINDGSASPVRVVAILD